MLGLGSGYNRLLFDGQPLFSGLASVYGIEHVPTAFISRVEVVKGGASSLYGPGAVAGVINILPNEPVVDKQRYDATLESVKGQAFKSVSLLRDWSSHNGDHALSLY
jgi:outer membrane receptor for ferrienterochelin and colicins